MTKGPKYVQSNRICALRKAVSMSILEFVVFSELSLFFSFLLHFLFYPLNAITGMAVWFPGGIADAGRAFLIGSSPSTEKAQVTAPCFCSQLQLDCEPSS